MSRIFSLLLALFMSSCAAAEEHVDLRPFRPYGARRSESEHRHKLPSAAFVVVSGSQYQSRARSVWSTWGVNVSHPNKFYFATDEAPLRWMNDAQRIPATFSGGKKAPDGYNLDNFSPYRRSQLKWLDAIMYLAEALHDRSLECDWVVFADDDTFLVPRSVLFLLSEYESGDALVIGKGGKDCDTLCGGAGFALSQGILLKLYSLRSNLVRAFFDCYKGNSQQIKCHSDVIISHFVIDSGQGRIVKRSEFRNFPPNIASKWKTLNLNDSQIEIVSFHRIDSSDYYQILFDYFETFSKVEMRRTKR
jgi:hypothetical protein